MYSVYACIHYIFFFPFSYPLLTPFPFRTMVGTVGYMAPELLRGDRMSEKIDVYGFAMVVWEMLTGEVPFADLSAMQVIWTVAAEGQRLPIPDEVPELFRSLIERCWQQDPRQRCVDWEGKSG